MNGLKILSEYLESKEDISIHTIICLYLSDIIDNYRDNDQMMNDYFKVLNKYNFEVKFINIHELKRIYSIFASIIYGDLIERTQLINFLNDEDLKNIVINKNIDRKQENVLLHLLL